jgi:hypothetical protein
MTEGVVIRNLSKQMPRYFLKSDQTASFHILSNSLHITHPTIQHYNTRDITFGLAIGYWLEGQSKFSRFSLLHRVETCSATTQQWVL